LLVSDSGVTWPAMNAAFVADAGLKLPEFASQLDEAIQYFSSRQREFMVVMAPELLPDDLRGAVLQELANRQFVPALQLEGMAADQLQPSLHPVPGLEIRPVGDQHTRSALAELNAVAYEIPPDWALEALATSRLWSDPVTGFVGYLDGRAVACAAVLLLEGVEYVALVATLPEYRGRGMAERVMRYALQAGRERTGWTRTALHSTPAGLSLYKKMGYRVLTSFTLYLRAESGAG
jgi:ribosomal protein S18 acetylase RimI-like enzyme